MQDYWHKQTQAKPLFPDLLWSRPENARLAGKLLIIGGNAQGFAAAAEAYQHAVKAGIGTARVLLPDSLQKTVGLMLEAGEYAPSTPSGSFAKKALAEFISMNQWADGTLIAGDLGRNSETAILLEQFLSKCTNQLTITKDAADYFIKTPDALCNRENTLLVISFAQLQKLATSLRFHIAFTFEMDLFRVIEALHELTEKYKIAVITRHLDNIFVAVNGQVSSTKTDAEEKVWRLKTAAHATVWWLQNPTKTFEALTTSLIHD